MGLTTKEAFTQLTSTKGWYKIVGMNVNTARSHKRHFKDGTISLTTVFKLLEKAGYKHKTIWEK